ncbi:MAG TPA: ABC transporter permease [Candidatus Binataceae bacterium]|jgi:ABC-2 type transport system permease protein|nr:ABC transporter permease [Candidatus Binataceae bacterium]
MFARIWQFVIKEFIQLWRDPRARFSLLVPPIIQVIVFGYAATFDVHNVATAILDQDHSQESRELISRFQSSGYFQMSDVLANGAQVNDLIDRGRVALAIQILPGFAENLRRRRNASVQVILDGTNSNTALIALGYINQITQRYQQDYRSDYLGRIAPLASQNAPQVLLVERPWYNKSLEDRLFFVPGTIGSVMMVMVMTLTAFAIVREREIGTLEQIMVTPIRPLEFILGKTVPYMMIALGELLIISLVGVWWFEVPMRGSIVILLAGSLLFIAGVLGVGLLISTISNTQQQAMVVSFFFIQPAITLSGFGFPISSMPPVLQWLTYLDPLRYYLVVLRGTFLKGIGVDLLWPQFVGMAAFATVTLAAASLRFRKTLD